ncbi:unknown [Prevotella sp. CAG:924]|nr:unknown [Prevotella sp. CAG:924]
MLPCQGIFKIQNLIIDGKANIEWKNEAATRLLASAVDEQQEHT